MGGKAWLGSYGGLRLVLWYPITLQLISKRCGVCICVSGRTCLGVFESLGVSVPVHICVHVIIALDRRAEPTCHLRKLRAETVPCSYKGVMKQACLLTHSHTCMHTYMQVHVL